MPPNPSLKILLAGVDKDARRDVEATVRQALGGRTATGPWSVSVVNFAGKWSVTLDGPADRQRGLSFVTEPAQFEDAIRKAVDGDAGGTAASVPPGEPAPAASSTEVRDAHVCEHCGGAMRVVYELLAGEPKERAPLACPHCWRVGHAEIGAWAATGGDYRCEKA